MEVKKILNKDDVTVIEGQVKEMPLEYVTVSEEIVKYAEEQLGKQLDESGCLALRDYIHFAITRCEQNLNVQNKLIWEIKRFYNEEYKIGCYALQLIKERIGIMLPADEAGNIALHIAKGYARYIKYRKVLFYC